MKATVALAACLLLMAVPARAQQSSLAERIKTLADRLASENARLVPVIGSTFPGGGASLGVRLQLGRVDQWGRISLGGAVSVRGGPMVELRWRRHGPQSRVTTAVLLQSQRAVELKRYVRMPDDRTVGQPFDVTQHLALASISVQAKPSVTVAGSAGYRGLGVGQRLDFLEAGVVVRGDWRPRPDPESRGTVARATFQVKHAVTDQTAAFRQLELEAVHLLALRQLRSVIAVRALSTTSHFYRGGIVPIVMLPEVGSGSTLRGFPHGRFRDRSRLVTSVEYRWRPADRVEAAVFVDYGAAGPSLKDTFNGERYTSAGVGLRLRSRGVTRARVDLAHSREGWRVVLATSQPF